MSMMIVENGMRISLESGHQPQFMTGLDASKSSSPGVGDTYFATDTGKTYTCFVATIWTLSSSPCVIEYSNHQGTVDNIMTTTVEGSGTAVTDNALHQMDLSVGANINSSSEYRTGIGIYPATQYFELNIVISSILNGDNNKNQTTRIGLIQDTNNGAYFLCNTAATWSIQTNRDGTYESTAVSISEGDLLTIIGKLNKIMYFVNGVLVATHQTITLGSTLYYPLVRVDHTTDAITIPRSVSCDYISWKIFK